MEANKCDNVVGKCKQMFEDIDRKYMLDLKKHFSILDVTQVRVKLLSNFINDRQVDLNREEAKSGPGQNKLHIYKVFKQDYGTEECIKCRSNRYSDRWALAQIRCGFSHIYIETCHYKNGIYVPVEDRICPVCHENIEDEMWY